MNPTRALALKIVKAYKSVVSPWLPAACRFTPTCSEYAYEAIEHYGVIRGVSRAIGRLFRCHPLHRGGFDPLT
jgi:putative membrane protein insertion efficiency factor